MSDANLISNSASVNGSATVEGVCTWIEGHVEKGNLPATGGRLRATALRMLVTVLGDDEPKNDARWVLDNLDAISSRWITKNNTMKPETARAYEQRARGALELFFEWSKDPKAFKFEPKSTAEKKTAERTAKTPPPPQVAAAPIVAPPEPVKPKAFGGSSEVRNFPLGEGREPITFVIPPEGISFADVRKFSVHLFTLAKDFNITDDKQSKVFQMVVRGEGA